jgi:hypothetical protein
VSFICPTGSVALLDGGAPLNDFFSAQTPNATNIARLNNRGFVEDQPIQLNVGAHNITATYSADMNSSYLSQTASNMLAVTITQATTTTQVAGSPSAITSGGSVTLTATISSTSNADKAHAPSGTVQFSNGATMLGAAVTCTQVGSTSSAGASCTAKLTTTLTALVPPVNFDHRPRSLPLEWLAALAAMVAVILRLTMPGRREPRRAYSYGVIALFLVASLALAACSGSGGGSSGGGTALTITAKFSGDSNYAGSQGTGTVTVH